MTQCSQCAETQCDYTPAGWTQYCMILQEFGLEGFYAKQLFNPHSFLLSQMVGHSSRP
uniref:Uncharacterized protein n=1 Tax=Anguilla anguilla TaxID=7936 RepID=A0A0E9TAD5_ANGAN